MIHVRRDPYRVAHLIAYFSYEQVNLWEEPAKDQRGIYGEKCDRLWVQGLEEWLCQVDGTYRDNKHSFLWLAEDGRYHLALFWDMRFTHISWDPKVYGTDVPSNIDPWNGGDKLVRAVVRQWDQFPNYAGPIRVQEYIRSPKDFLRQTKRLQEMPLGTLWLLKGDDGSWWKCVNCGDDGVRSSRLIME